MVTDRIADEDITKFYDKSRIKKLCAPAGTMAFGDTSCVHKGEIVRSGHRIMLQLEYASSLYISPVIPFSDLPADVVAQLPYPAPVRARLLANYNSQQRAEFQNLTAQHSVPEPSLLRKWLRLAKRHLTRAY